MIRLLIAPSDTVIADWLRQADEGCFAAAATIRLLAPGFHASLRRFAADDGASTPASFQRRYFQPLRRRRHFPQAPPPPPLMRRHVSVRLPSSMMYAAF